MNEQKALSTVPRYYVIGVDENGMALADRRDGTHSFLKEVNARRFAHRLSRENVGERFYVVKSLAGFLATASVTKAIY